MHIQRAIVFVVIIASACSSSGPQNATRSSPPPINSTTNTPSTGRSSGAATTTSTSPPVRDIPKTTAQIEGIDIALQTISTGLDSPVAAATRANDARLYVAEQHTGRVVAIDTKPNDRAPSEVLNLRGAVAQGNEQGLLGLAFSVDGTKLFVHYNDPAGDSHIDEYTVSNKPDVAAVVDVATRREILRQKQPFPNHNGGQLAVDSNDLLYIGFGDGGLAGDPLKSGQDLNSLLGKILRIDPRPSGSSAYRAPADNPFVSRDGARPEIWQWGLRNPWRFSFDSVTNDLWIGDVGQNVYEEVDHIAANVSGVNFGWNLREGNHSFDDGAEPIDSVDPVVEYSHDDGGCSVTGGYVYRGSAIPKLNGVYVFADYCAGNLIGVSAEANNTTPAQGSLGINVKEPTSFAQDNDGEVYVLSRDGSISKLVSK